MVKPGSVRLGPVEWGTVVAHWPYGLDVFLDSSGEVGTVGITWVNDSTIRTNEEYWPDVGDRVRVRRLPDVPGGELRLTAQQGVVNGWSEPREVVRGRVYEWPAGLGETEQGVVTTVHERGFDVRLEASGDVGTVMWSLVEADRAFFSTGAFRRGRISCWCCACATCPAGMRWPSVCSRRMPMCAT